MAVILLWFGWYPSAWIILVKGYITAKHSSGTGIMSVPGSPSHHTRAAGTGWPQVAGCCSSPPHLPCSGVVPFLAHMGSFFPENHIGSVISITGLFRAAPQFGLPLPGTFPGHLEGHGTSDIPGAGLPWHKAARLSDSGVGLHQPVRPFHFFLFYFLFLESIWSNQKNRCRLMLLAVGLAEERGSREDVPLQTKPVCTSNTQLTLFMVSVRLKEEGKGLPPCPGKKQNGTWYFFSTRDPMRGTCRNGDLGYTTNVAGSCSTASGLPGTPASPSWIPHCKSLKISPATTLRVYPGLCKLLQQEQHSQNYLNLL